MEFSSGKIFLAEQRGVTENQVSRSYFTFNFKQYYNENKSAFGNLFLCNDELIADGKNTFLHCEEYSLHIFIPITGGITIVRDGKELVLDTGQVQVLHLRKGEVLEIINSYQCNVINYLHFGIKTEMFSMQAIETLYHFDFDRYQNQLIKIITTPKLPFRLNAGIFAGRAEAIYKMQNNSNQIYAFVIDGAFEIEGRLLHARDGLGLWNVQQVELEALSNNAILVVLELGL
ncbi:hypothetical protein ACFE6N_21320 [Pedobacter sp. BG31]|uniref:pirin family protein n=1 Tax=Pedobacter sp. BG31 TaxID=3349697 RepID=UPI0035F3021A